MPKSPNRPQRPKESDLAPKPIVEVGPYSYRPRKAELEADMPIPATPEELAKAVVRDVMVVTAPTLSGIGIR